MNTLKLTTVRLSLEPFTELDETLFLTINTSPFVRKYLWDDQLIDPKTVRKILLKNKQHFAEEGFGLWKVRLKTAGTCVGYVGLWHFFEEPQPQLIYALLEPFSGRGLATESAQAVMAYAFQNLGFEYLLAATDEPNTASQKVALRLNMHLVEKKNIEGKSTLFFRIDRIAYNE